MKNETHDVYTTRESILTLLSDEENARVSTAETAVLAMGDEFIDLTHVGKGVQRADGRSTATEDVLPRKAVGAGTWAKILKQVPHHGP